jgi:hypothetical protein
MSSTAGERDNWLVIKASLMLLLLGIPLDGAFLHKIVHRRNGVLAAIKHVVVVVWMRRLTSIVEYGLLTRHWT